MITPGFSPTATERVLPKLALDFTTASLDSRVTFTRTTSSTNPATYINSSGYVTSATNNQPRFDYDPVTKICKGLLIEEARTNLLNATQTFNSSDWKSLNATVSNNVTTSPDSTNNGSKFVTANSTTNQGRYFSISLAASTAYTVSVYAKAAEYSRLTIVTANSGQVPNATFDVSNGSVISAGSGTTASISNAGNGWWRCTATRTSGSGGTDYLAFYINNGSGTNFAGDGTSGIYMWGAQFEVGAFATSYIPNTATSGTTARNADVATMTGTNFSSWFNASEGAFSIVGASNGRGVGNAALLGVVSDGTTSNNMLIGQMISNNVRTLVVNNSGVNDVLLTSQATTFPTANINCTGAYKLNNFAGAKDGAFLQTDTSGAVPSCNQFTIGSYIGSTGNQYMNGWVRSVRYWPQRLTNAEVQAFSKG